MLIESGPQAQSWASKNPYGKWFEIRVLGSLALQPSHRHGAACLAPARSPCPLPWPLQLVLSRKAVLWLSAFCMGSVLGLAPSLPSKTCSAPTEFMSLLLLLYLSPTAGLPLSSSVRWWLRHQAS